MQLKIKFVIILSLFFYLGYSEINIIYAKSELVFEFVTKSFLNSTDINGYSKNGKPITMDFTKIVSENIIVNEELFDNQKKSINGIGRVLIFDNRDSIINHEQAINIIKERIEVSRFDINEVVFNNQKIFDSIKNIDSNTLIQLEQILRQNYLKKIKDILSNPIIQQQRINQFKEQNYSFKFSKGRGNSVTKSDLESLFNSSFIYVPYIEKVELTKNKFLEAVDDETILKKIKVNLQIVGGLLWYQVKLNQNNKAELVFIAHIKSSNGKQKVYDRHKLYSEDIELLVNSALNTLGDNLIYTTKSLKQFKIYGKVIASEKNKHTLQFPKSIPITYNDHFWLMENYESPNGIKNRKVGLAYIKSMSLNEKNKFNAKAIQVYGSDNELMSWVKEVPYMGISLDVGYYRLSNFYIDNRDALISNSTFLFDKPITQASGLGINGSFDISKFINSSMAYFDVRAMYYPISINYFNQKNPNSYILQLLFNLRKVFWINHYAISPFLGGGSMLFEIQETDDYFYNMKSAGLIYGASIEKMIRPFLSIEFKYQNFLSIGYKSIKNTINNDSYSKNADYSKMNSNMLSVSLKITK